MHARRNHGYVALFALALIPTIDALAAADARTHCRELSGTSIPAPSIGLPTTGALIISGVLSEPSDPNGEFCKVLGAIKPVDPKAPDINFQVNLPVNWNGKALHLGGGGYNGTVVSGLARYLPPDVAQPLKQGYVTYGSDAGHTGTSSDASFAMNDEALANFGHAQLKKTHDVAVELMKRHYGKPPRRMYFQGSSQGGHEGFIVMQRWPEAYDGVVAIHPVYNMTALQLGGVRIGQALYSNAGAWLSPKKLSLIYDSVMKTCDGLDGLADGIISNVQGCRSTFKVGRLRCTDGTDTGNSCLSDAQLGAVHTIDSDFGFGFTLQEGVDGFSKWPILEGGSTAGRFALGQSPIAAKPPGSQDALIYVMGDQMVRHMALRDPGYDTLGFVPKEHAARLQQVADIVDASSVELEPFRRRGGKLIFIHGTVDMAVPQQNTIDYYHRLVKRFGAGPLREFASFYIVPGFGHGDGPFLAGWDWVGALDGWADKGQSPTDLVAVDTDKATAGRTRPMCEYPAWPKYRGTGDANDAASFVCEKR